MYFFNYLITYFKQNNSFFLIIIFCLLSSSIYSQSKQRTTFFETTPEVEQELRIFYGHNTLAIKYILEEINNLEKEKSAIVISSTQYNAVVNRFLNNNYYSESHKQKEMKNEEKYLQKYVSVGDLIKVYNQKNN